MTSNGFASECMEAHHSSLDDFGVPLGESRFKFPAHIKPRQGDDSCVVDEKATADSKDDATDCQFTDHAGTSYFVFGQTLTRKDMKVAEAAGHMPFGLTAGDAIGDVLRKLAGLNDAPKPLYTERVGEETVISTEYCLRNMSGHAFVHISPSTKMIA